MSEPSDPNSAGTLFEAHPRSFEQNRYVYPVLSRRAGGISIGVNLSPDKACNFNCVYCQVDRSRPGRKGPLELGRLVRELDAMFELVTSGRIYQQTKFRHTPQPLRRLNDVALSGDGEPTVCRQFSQVVSACVDACRRRPEDVKLLLLTNAGTLHGDRVRRALSELSAAGGRIWTKLDAGTESYYRQVARSEVPWQQILDNLREAAQAQPIVIQSLWMRIQGRPPPPHEQDAFCRRLGEILDAGGRIELVQIHTIARPPAEDFVTRLSGTELQSIAEKVRSLTGLPAETF